MAQFLFKRSGTASKRPDPLQMALGEVDLNYDSVTGGLFYKDSAGTIIKVGPAQVSATAPNATPAGSAGNALGEFWYDTGASALCIWDGSAWQATGGGGGIPPSTFTACGDLIVGTGAGTYTALPIPRDFFSNVVNGCVLTTCSTEASGLAWVTPPYVSSTTLNASSIGALIVNGCDIGGGACVTAILPGPGQPGQILTNAYNAGDPGYLAAQGYLNWCTPNFISQSSFSPGTLVVGCTPSSTGGLCTIGALTNINNPGVQPGYYQGVTVTTCTGTGTGALATVNVINAGYFPIFDFVEVTQPGTGYALGNQVGFVICGTTVTTRGAVCSLDQTTICKAGYLPVGTNGQVLTVDSACALGVKWAAGGGGGSGIPCSVLTAKGDMIVASGANTPVALPVGFNGQVLVACSTCTNGLGWANIPAATPAVSGVVRGISTDGLTLNTALGLGSLNTSLTGERNTAVGSATLGGLTTGSRNASFGQASLAAVETGNDNTGLGYASLGNATGSDNTAVGSAAAQGVTGGTCNTAVGSCSLASATSGSSNIAIGYKAGCLITTGSQNVVIGPQAQVPNVINSCQLAIGFSATDYWLTGTCTKAIKPGAGIIDCADSTGTAGQVLMSNGSNAICWGSVSGSAATPLVAGIVFGCTLATGTGSTALGSGALKLPPVGACNVAVGLNAGCGVNNGACNTIVGALAGDALTDGCNNTVLGFSALSGAATTCDATAVGSNALCAATGAANTAVGSGAMKSLTTGACNTAVGVAALCSSTAASNNTAVGYQSQFLNNGGTQNTSLGVVALYSNVTGIQNTAIGNNALTNATSSNNTAVGTCASASNVAGANNTSVGNSALKCNTTGSNNASVGINSLFNTIGSGNVAVGANAGCTSTAGDCNIVIGANVQLPLTTGSCQLAVGFGTTCWLTGCSTGAIRPGAGIMDCTGATGTAGQFLMSNGSNAICWGAVPQATATTLGTVYGRNDACFNAAYGQDALCCMGPTGPFVVSNVAVGNSAMRCSTSGAQNVAIGLIAMCNTSGASFNVAVGAGSLTSNINGNYNVVLGPAAAPNITASWCNIAIGASALNATATVFDNVAVGTNSLLQTTGNSNVAIGHTAGSTLTTGCSNVIIGNCVQAPVATGSCQLAIGYSATCNWLTGCSDKSIRPGAGIMDCAGATGTAGQVLMSNGANAICWGTVSGGSAATPTAAGTVLGVTNATNAGLGCNVLASNTGTNNTALGLNAGCSITTGSCNLALGNNVQVATAAGDCQLAIGFSATDNWLTGDSTKAIQPGAGILDCAGSGGAAGQALFSNGANAICWGNTLDLNLFCCQNAAGCGQLGGNLIVGGYGDGNITPTALYPGEGGQILTIDPVNGANPLKWCTANYLCGACFTKGSIPVGCVQVGGGIQTVGIVNQNNPGKPPGYYANVPVGGGSGTGAIVNVNIINVGYFPAVDSVEVVTPGTGYINGETGLTMTIDGTTLTTTLTVSSLNTNTIFNYSYLSVGSNGQVLTADSACTNGVKWAAPGSATPLAAGAVFGCTLANGTGATALGSGALAALPTGTCNVAVGLNAGCAVNTGVLNTLVGSLAGDALTSGGSNTAVGACALSGATTTSNVTAIGACAVCRGTAEGTTAVGTCALRDLTSGTCNTAVGCGALRLTTTGADNTAVGRNALAANLAGLRNTAVGLDSLANTCGCDNVGVGVGALNSIFNNSGNTALGACAFATATGNFNTAIGFQAGCDFNGNSGSNNIVIGCCAATSTGGVSGPLGLASNRIVFGNSAHTCAQIQIAWTTTSDVRDKALDPAGVPYGLLFVEQLEPIAYRWCNRETNEVTDEKLRFGFSAQNVRSLEGDEPVIVSDDNPDRLMITDQHLLPVLVNAIKELSEKNKLLEERIAALEDKA